jgi:archaellum component FlaC
MRQVANVVLAVLLAAAVAMAQGNAAPATKARVKKRSSTTDNVSTQLSQMQQSIAAQQQQIQQLMQQLQGRDQQIQQLQQQMNQLQSTASQAQQKADTAASQTAEQKQEVSTVRNDVGELKDALTNTTLALQETQKNVNESPLALRFKGITITPGGFLAAETVWRQRGLASDVNTPFNSLPFPGSSASNLSEFYASGRQSRVAMLAEGKLKDLEMAGYVEADFLSAGVTSNNNQSNSYTLRQRQMWAQAAIHGWSFTGGQMWSLVTETKKGVDNRSETLPLTIDAQYTLGFSWARQFGFRVAKNFGDKAWLALSLENPQINSIGGSGFNNNFFVGAPGNGGGLDNTLANYSFNAAPDFIVKAAFEPGFGHYEVFGVLSQFHDRIYPCATTAATDTCNGVLGPSGTGASNDLRAGGGIGVNMRESFFKKHVDVGVHFLGGNGIERYGTGGLPVVTVRPNGTLAPLRGYQGLGTLEFHSAKWDWYLNGGSEYAQRTVFTDPTSGKAMGYGLPGASNGTACVEPVPGSGGFAGGTSCSGTTRALTEGTLGFWYRIYNGPKGKLQFGPQYSYVLRSTWTGANGFAPKATENMFFTSFRYYLP